MREPKGQTFVESYSVLIPPGLPAGTVQLTVGDGTHITGAELKRSASGIPMDLKTAIRELNKLRRNDRLYARILSNQPGGRDSRRRNAFVASVNDWLDGYRSGVESERYDYGNFGSCRI
jgi:hypothetical protein